MKLIKDGIILLLIGLPSLAIKAAEPTTVELKRGMVITKSILVKKGNYAFDGYDSLNRPVILIKGDNIIVDFNDAVLKGSITTQIPSEFFGLAIMIRGNNITLKNANTILI